MLPGSLSQLEYGARNCAVSLRFNDLTARYKAFSASGNDPAPA
ncbi:hypothetical protein HMPREF9205_0301 [Cutibacterium acnes SK182]|nr:hypothetical protein HMPREF9205_0301 [Cutibacterium acnes SK182]